VLAAVREWALDRRQEEMDAECSVTPEDPERRHLSSNVADEAEEEVVCSYTPEEAKEDQSALTRWRRRSALTR
jgi:hypothetical protein